jgi:hypothetical protein
MASPSRSFFLQDHFYAACCAYERLMSGPFSAGNTTRGPAYLRDSLDNQPHECADTGFDGEGDQESLEEAKPFWLYYPRRPFLLMPTGRAVTMVN